MATPRVVPDPDLHKIKSTLGGLVLRGNLEAAAQARRALGLARTVTTIRRAIEAAPPLDQATLATIRSLIPPAPASGGTS
jgi:hypothetical protein